LVDPPAARWSRVRRKGGDGGAPLYRGGGSDLRWCCLAREDSPSSSEISAIARTRNARGSTSARSSSKSYRTSWTSRLGFLYRIFDFTNHLFVFTLI